jgi:hypothetical protein
MASWAFIAKLNFGFLSIHPPNIPACLLRNAVCLFWFFPTAESTLPVSIFHLHAFEIK